jgi:hypothetical protein
MNVKSNLENLYHQYLDHSFELTKLNRGHLSTTIFCGLVYRKLNQCALKCLRQIQNAAKGKKILDTCKSEGIHFPIVIDAKKNPTIAAIISPLISTSNVKKVIHSNIFNGDELNLQVAYGLTALHLATIQGSYDLVREMLQSGLVDVNAKDRRGWTAMHHAAVKGDREMINLLKSYGGDPTILNHRSGNVADLLNLCSPVKVDENQPLPLVVWKENQEQRPLTFAEFKKIAHAEYLTEYFVDPAWLLKDWEKNTTYTCHPFFRNLNISQRFSEYRKNPPHLILERDPQVGLDVKTADKLMKGQGVTEYLGEVVSSTAEIKNLEYVLESVDGNGKRNLGPIINDGFPNVTSITEFNAGMKRHFMFMLDDAEAGERLCWNYGSGHDVKAKVPHVELRREAILSFFKKHSLSLLAMEIKQALKAEKASTSETLDIYSKIDKVKYIIDTPTSLLHLLFANVITLKDFEELLHDQELREILNIRSALYTCYQEQMLPIMRKLMAMLVRHKEVSPESYLQICHELIKKLDQLSLEDNLGIYQSLIDKFY